MANYNKKHKKKKIEANYIPPYEADILNIPIEKLALREVTYDLLKKANFNILQDLLKREEKDFYKIMTFNKKNLFDLKSALIKLKVDLKPSSEQSKEVKVEVIDNNNLNKNKNVKNNTLIKAKEEKAEIIEAYIEEKPERKPPVVEKEPIVLDKYLKISKNELWGFSDRQGKEVIPPIYDSVFNFSEDLCCVEKDELFGFIDRKGDLVIPIIYDCACSFSKGLACVFKKDLCGYIDKNHNIIIDFKFDAGTSFEDKSCRVKKDGKWAQLNLNDRENEPQEFALYTLRWIN